MVTSKEAYAKALKLWHLPSRRGSSRSVPKSASQAAELVRIAKAVTELGRAATPHDLTSKGRKSTGEARW
jgi:hypothetical protein